MDSFDQWDELANTILRDDDFGGEALGDLVRLCLPFLRSTALRLNFERVLRICNCKELGRDAVSDAIVRSRETGKPFHEFLGNCMRDVCRREERRFRARQLIELAEELNQSRIVEMFGGKVPLVPSQVLIAENRELLNLFQDEVRNEPPLCQRVMAQHHQGAKFPEIEAELGLGRNRARTHEASQCG